jgi:hypothetical protein
MEKNVIYARQRHVWMNVMYDTGRQYIAATVTYGKNVIYAFYRAD